MTRPIENLRKKRSTGGKTIPGRGRRAFEFDGFALEPVLGKQASAGRRVRGGGAKVGVVKVEFANVVNPADHTARKVKVGRVVENGSKRDYERRGVITRGAVIETEAGRARVTSRPSQDGVVNAVLMAK
ncbi:MAG: 30S ribosomal protein S8e [Nitrososphaerota archaeon]|nr:30S ribosomal protein S8e [Nitrososphaerota archaeon]MDG6939478.1 30S ribosomal protein S8e [Nitrososphaerota archaeon]